MKNEKESAHSSCIFTLTFSALTFAPLVCPTQAAAALLAQGRGIEVVLGDQSIEETSREMQKIIGDTLRDLVSPFSGCASLLHTHTHSLSHARAHALTQLLFSDICDTLRGLVSPFSGCDSLFHTHTHSLSISLTHSSCFQIIVMHVGTCPYFVFACMCACPPASGFSCLCACMNQAKTSIHVLTMHLASTNPHSHIHTYIHKYMHKYRGWARAAADIVNAGKLTYIHTHTHTCIHTGDGHEQQVIS